MLARPPDTGAVGVETSVLAWGSGPHLGAGLLLDEAEAAQAMAVRPAWVAEPEQNPSTSPP